MRKIIIIILLVITSSASYAEHFVGIAVSPAATWQLDTLSSTRSLPGIAANLGFVYQYQHKALMLQTGINLGFTTMRQDLDSMYIGQNTLLRNRVDDIHSLDLSLPLMMGFQQNHFYAIAGVRLAIASNATTSQRGSIAVRQEDDRFHEDYNKAFLDTSTFHSKGKITISPDLRACLEIGTQLHVYKYHRVGDYNPILQIGLFAEYSVLYNHPTNYTETNTANHTDIAPQHIYAQYINQDLKINHLHAGIRLRLLFDITNDDCHCEDF